MTRRSNLSHDLRRTNNWHRSRKTRRQAKALLRDLTRSYSPHAAMEQAEQAVFAVGIAVGFGVLAVVMVLMEVVR